MAGDQLIQIIDAALADAARRAGAWLACRPGCAECCIGPFGISSMDARRLREGLAAIGPERAQRIRERARASMARLQGEYPGDTVAQLLAIDEAGENEPCPALDPETRTCDLYAWRPVTCRTFGPPIRFAGESLAVCELCFDGATPEEVAACEVEIDLGGLEEELLAGHPSETIVAWAVLE